MESPQNAPFTAATEIVSCFALGKFESQTRQSAENRYESLLLSEPA